MANEAALHLICTAVDWSDSQFMLSQSRAQQCGEDTLALLDDTSPRLVLQPKRKHASENLAQTSLAPTRK